MRHSARTLVSLFGVTSFAIVAACSSNAPTTTVDAAPPPLTSSSSTSSKASSSSTKKSSTTASSTTASSSSTATDGGKGDAGDATVPKEGGSDAAKDGEAKDGEAKDGEPKDGEAKDGAKKDGETKDAEKDAKHDAGHDAGAPTLVQNYFMGRWDTTAVTPANTATGVGAVAGWPGTGVITTFLGGTGANIGVTLTDTCNPANDTAPDVGCDSVTIEIDGKPVTAGVLNGMQKTGPSFQLISGSNTLLINTTTTPSLATAGDHTVGVYKNTETFYGGTYSFGGFTPQAGQATNNPKASYTFTHHIEFIGDDDMAGVGVTCGSTNSPTGAATTDAHDSYATLIAEYFDADHQNLSVANVGVYESDPPGGPPPVESALYTTVLPTEATSMWNFASFTPDLVVVNLGGFGDFSNVGNTVPGTFPGDYETALEGFLTTVRTKHPMAFILVTLGPGYGGGSGIAPGTCNMWGQAAVAHQLTNGETASTMAFFACDPLNGGVCTNAAITLGTTNFGGCQFRASVADHQAFAAALEAEIKSLLPTWKATTWAP